MIAKIIDGTRLADSIFSDIKSEIADRKRNGIREPVLAVLLVGENESSKIYVNRKTKKCHEIGIVTKDFNLDKNVQENSVLEIIHDLNKDNNIDGILVQLPLPDHIDPFHIIEAIDPRKDVDGFHPENIGRLAIGKPMLRPCTPKGIIDMIKYTEVEMQGMNAVIIGASNIVGKPMALELLRHNCTVSICHIFTDDVIKYSSKADIIVVAVGIPNFLRKEYVKEGAIVIDVGINRLESGKVVGDVDFDNVKNLCSWISPVPGGVGQMTVASLLDNTMFAAREL